MERRLVERQVVLPRGWCPKERWWQVMGLMELVMGCGRGVEANAMVLVRGPARKMWGTGVLPVMVEVSGRKVRSVSERVLVRRRRESVEVTVVW